MQISKCIKIMTASALLLIMPGPTNTLLLFSGFTYGFFKSIRMMLAEWMGYFLAISIWGLIFSNLSRYGDEIIIAIKVLSAIYVCFLAIKVWRFSLHTGSANIKFKNVFIATCLNPKAFIFAAYIIPLTAFIDAYDYFNAMLSVFFALSPVSFIWIYFGVLIKSRNDTSIQIKPEVLYRIASLAMSLFAVSMIYTSVQSVLL